jgi:hypothetical protein
MTYYIMLYHYNLQEITGIRKSNESIIIIYLYLGAFARHLDINKYKSNTLWTCVYNDQDCTAFDIMKHGLI